MAKKDEDIREEIIREKNDDIEQIHSVKEVPDEIKSDQTEVKNANAAGLGSMGRNDENEMNTDPQSKESELEKY
ncbi:MAG TPA: hypothetical protein VGO09_06880 [Flavisolibacter sp.]|jgi:hypothetical protein|nr:hypothetical protein [Flavisolibacter sp.]